MSTSSHTLVHNGFNVITNLQKKDQFELIWVGVIDFESVCLSLQIRNELIQSMPIRISFAMIAIIIKIQPSMQSDGW